MCDPSDGRLIILTADGAPGTTAQLDILSAAARIKQLSEEADFDGSHYLWRRLVECDLPRLTALLAPEVIEWMERTEESWRRFPVPRRCRGCG
jgi:hypothetical protein